MNAGLTPRRTIALVTLIGLGVVAALDLDVRYEPDLTMPEVHVRLSLPPSLSLQPDDVARRWAVPIESAARAVGGVEALAGTVSTTGFDLTARFSAGTDIETKIARIQSELEPLRANLPESSFLDVSAETLESGTYLVATGDLQPDLVRQIEREIESLPSVRTVQSFGSRRVATTVDVTPDADRQNDVVDRARQEVGEIGRVSRLGVVRRGGAEVPVYSRGPAGLRDVRIGAGSGVVPLESLAEISRGKGRRVSGGRYDGRSAIVIGVQRDADVSLLEFDRELGARLESIRLRLPPGSVIEPVQSESEPLRRLLRRAGLGFLGAMLILAVTGWLSGGSAGLLVGLLALPAALSIALNAIRLTGLPLDVTTIPALGVGLIVPVALLLVPSRSKSTYAWACVTVLCGAALPIAVVFAAGLLATFLIAPAKVYALGMASVAACLILIPSIDRPARKPGAGKKLRSVLRNAPTLLLMAATACYALLTMFGSELDPRRSSVVPDRGRIFVRASFPEGTTLEQAEDGASRLEEKIGLVDGVERVWGRVVPEQVILIVDVSPDRRSAEDLEEISSDIRHRTRLPFGHVIVRPGTGGTRVDARSIEMVPEANDDGLYSLVLEGDEIGNLESTVERIDALARNVNGRVSTVPEWGARSVRFELRPATPESQSRLREVASVIAARALPPRETPVGRDEVIIVRRAGEEEAWSAPSRAAVLDVPHLSEGGTIVPSAHLKSEEEVVSPTVSRQSGRFVVRVLVSRAGTWDLDHWLGIRKEIDRRLSNLEFMSGAEMKRPEIRPFRLNDDGVRLLVMASAVPLLIVLIAVVWVNSLWRFLPFILPPVLGVAAATVVIGVSGTGVDELSLVMLAGTCFGVLAVSLACGERLIRGDHLVADGYRTAAITAVPVIGAALACGVLLIGSASGTDAVRDPWASGARIAGAAALGSLPVALVLPVSTFYALDSLRRRRTLEMKAKRRPSEWAGDAPISLEVRHVSKVYRGGFRALRDVSFDLRPGIVGLLGPNGAGKTTLLRILTGLLLPSRGQVLYRGHPVGPINIDAFREHIGFLPQSFNAYPGFTAEEFVDFWAMQAGISDRKRRAEEVELLIAAVGLEEHARRKVRDFSGGMRQRIGIARALIAQPDLLVVDEPTTGLDIEGRSRFRGLMLSVAAHRVVVLSTHIAGDVEATCSRVLLLHRGRLRFDGAPDELMARAEGRVFEMTVADQDIHEISSRYRLTRRVRVMDGIRVKGVVPSGEALPGPAAAPGLEEAYLAEIELADVTVGRKPKFTFLLDT